MGLSDEGRAHDIVGVDHKGLAGHLEIGNSTRVWKGTTIMEGHGGFINSTAAEQCSFFVSFICSLIMTLIMLLCFMISNKYLQFPLP